MELFYSWTILEPTIKLTFKTFGVRDGIDNSWVSPQMWAMHISANHRYVETLHFLGFFLTFLLWNPCAFALVRLRSKNHLVRFSKRSYFGLKYLVWSPQKHLEISEVQKNMSQQQNVPWSSCEIFDCFTHINVEKLHQAIWCGLRSELIATWIHDRRQNSRAFLTLFEPSTIPSPDQFAWRRWRNIICCCQLYLWTSHNLSCSYFGKPLSFYSWISGVVLCSRIFMSSPEQQMIALCNRTEMPSKLWKSFAPEGTAVPSV